MTGLSKMVTNNGLLRSMSWLYWQSMEWQRCIFCFLLTPLVTSNWRFLSNWRWCRSIETYPFIKSVYADLCGKHMNWTGFSIHIFDQILILTCTIPWFHLPQTLCSSQDIPSPQPQPLNVGEVTLCQNFDFESLL